VVILACLALLGGLVIGKFRVYGIGWLPVLLAPVVVAGWRRKRVVFVAAICICCLSLGWWRGAVYERQMALYQMWAKHKIVLTGQASLDGVYGQHEQLTFTMDHLRIVSPSNVTLVGQISVSGFGAPAVNRGDIVQVQGSLYPTRGSNLASMSFATLRVLQPTRSVIELLRHKFTAGLQSALPEPAASFGLGLLVGQRNTLPANVSQMLLMVGLTHIIAVSGYNLTILIKAARKIFGNRSKFQATMAFLVLIGGFLLLTGSSPSIVRAAIVSVLSIGAWYYGRTVRPLVLLLAASVITGLATPRYVWGDVSWYLSFLAFFGVLIVSPVVTRALFGKREPKLIAGIVVESLCAELMTMPYILHIFGQMSLVSIPANVLIAALIPLAMLLTMIAGLAGMVTVAIAGWFAWPAKLVLTYMLDVAGLLCRIPHIFVEQVGFSVRQMVVSYVIVFGMGIILRHRNLRKYAIITDRTSRSSDGRSMLCPDIPNGPRLNAKKAQKMQPAARFLQN
jgi:competence protein ComEC